MKKLPNIHPGEVLLEEFLVPMEISQNALARAANVPPRRINEIVLGKRGITADTALRLAAFFGTSEGFWLGLQADYDLEETRALIGKDLLRVEQAGAHTPKAIDGRRSFHRGPAVRGGARGDYVGGGELERVREVEQLLMASILEATGHKAALLF